MQQTKIGEIMIDIKFENACKKAYDKLKEDNFVGIYLVVDIGDRWVFFGGNPEDVYYGVRTVSVEKNTGNCKWFTAQLEENYVKLENGTEVEIPYKFKYDVNGAPRYR